MSEFTRGTALDLAEVDALPKFDLREFIPQQQLVYLLTRWWRYEPTRFAIIAKGMNNRRDLSIMIQFEAQGIVIGLEDAQALVVMIGDIPSPHDNSDGSLEWLRTIQGGLKASFIEAEQYRKGALQ
jgi:hypothetical protein